MGNVQDDHELRVWEPLTGVKVRLDSSPMGMKRLKLILDDFEVTVAMTVGMSSMQLGNG